MCVFIGVALAFDQPLYLHPDLKEICSEFYRTTDPLSAGMKLAYVSLYKLIVFKITKKIFLDSKKLQVTL